MSSRQHLTIFKGEDCHGGKRSKERITLLLTTNATGTDKLKALVIGKSAKPRCFKGIKSLPVEYHSNKKAWMNMGLFHTWLTDLNKKMKKSNRKILLFIDNCTAHNDVPKLSHVKIEFFPANTTSKLQPLDQGIIKNFKSFYRKEIIQKLTVEIDHNKKISPINLLEAVRFISKAWHNVTESTIINCFRKSGFPVNSNVVAETPTNNSATQSQLEIVNNFLNTQNVISFEEYVNVDNEVVVSGKLSDDDIIESINDENNNDCFEDDCDDNVEEKPVSNFQVKSAMNILRNFIEKCENVDEEIFSHLVKIENVIDIKIQDSLKQKKITDFFTKR